MRKRQQIFPNFLKMRIFLSKLVNNSSILRKKKSHFEKIGEGFLSFSQHFPMIFVSVPEPWRILNINQSEGELVMLNPSYILYNFVKPKTQNITSRWFLFENVSILIFLFCYCILLNIF